MTLGIECITHYFPGQPVSNQDIIEQHEFDEAFIRDKLGIETRYTAGKDQYASDLAIAACNRLFESTGIDRQSIGLLAVVTQTPDYCLPHVSALVHGSVGLSTQCAAFDINLGCSGYVYALANVIAMMESQGISTGVIITTETYSKLMSPTDRATAPLFGDAATATLIGPKPAYVIGRVDFGTDGTRHASLIARGSAVRRDVDEPLFMDGRDIFSLVMGEVPKSIGRCLKINNKRQDDIDAWVFHQANRFVLNGLAKKLGIPIDKMVIDLADVGNTTSSTIPITLERQILSREPQPEAVCISGFGVGLSWASTILYSTK